MSRASDKLLMVFYGDDFTGSSDALEFLSTAGVKTVLFIEPPTEEQLSRFKDLDAIGVAGMTRSMSPQEMEKVLRPAFTALKKLGALHVHYKVCSTFDSSPHVGSIGKAIDIGSEIFSSPFIPLLVAAPVLGRYCLFGNLFARMGIGSKGEIHRLDRHPSMSKHPVTPAHESDLRLHLAEQTSKKIGLINILQVSDGDLSSGVEAQIAAGNEIILFDALYDEQMIHIGKVINSYTDKHQTLFSAGSSGIEMALGKFWKEQGMLRATPEWQHPGKAKSLFVVSGSCSPVTSGQITWALAHGFTGIALDTIMLMNGDLSSIEEYISIALKAINSDQSVIAYTSLGDNTHVENSTELFGSALAKILLEVIQNTKIKRVVIAGGDTSSFIARALKIEAVEMIAPLCPGAPLCKVYAAGEVVDGLEINFKGGQVGAEDYFGMVMEGKIK